MNREAERLLKYSRASIILIDILKQFFRSAIPLLVLTACTAKTGGAIVPSIGQISYQNSMVASSAQSVVSGSQALVTLSLKDSDFNPYLESSAVVTFQLSQGTSTGTFGPVTDLQNGSYTTVFTGGTPGTPSAILGFVDGVEIQSTSPSISVLASNYSLSLSTLNISQSTLTSNATATVTLTVKDTSGNTIGGGGYSVNFSIANGTSTGTFGATIDHGDGTYSATFTGGSAGTATQVHATLQGGLLTSSSPTVTVVNSAPSSLTYSTPTAVYTVGSAIANNLPSSGGGSVSAYSITPSLPSGLVFNTNTGVISGIPTVISGLSIYTITASNSSGNTVATLSLTVNDIAPSSLTYSLNPGIYTKNTAITNQTPANLGGMITSYSVSPALPLGLSFNTSTGVISGTPTTLTVAQVYTIVGINSGGSTSVTLSFTVNDIAPSLLSYSTSPATYTKNTVITNNIPAHSGGTVLSYSVNPSLPPGLSLSSATGVISGTPSALSNTTSYTITATNSGGSTTSTLSITVIGIPASTLTYSSDPAVYTKGVAITNNTPSNAGGAITSYSISPALSAGLSLNTSTGIISGTPTAITATTSYTVTGVSSGGNASATVIITVNDAAPASLTYTSATSVYINGTAITNNSPTSSGGAVVSYSVSPSLPAGLSFNASTGVISGTPTAISSAASYTVTATNTGGSIPVTISITVNDAAPVALVYSQNPVIYTYGVPISTNAPANSGGTITSYSVTPALPSSLSFNTTTGGISGTPIGTSATASYTVTGSNVTGSTTASISITVGTASITVYSGNNQVGTAGNTLTNPLVAIAKLANGNPISGTTIDWTVTAGGGTLSATSGVTDINGLSSVTLTLGPNVANNTATAKIHGSPYTTTFTATDGTVPTPTPYTVDLATIPTRQSNHGYPRLANDTQVSYGGSSSNGFAGQNLFARLHWYDYLIIDGNTSATTSYGTLTNYLGSRGSIRALNPNSVQVAYFSLADFLNSPANICYQPLLTYYAFGSGFNVSNCTDPGTNDLNPAWLYHDVSGNTLALYNFGSYYSHIPDPNNSGLRLRYMNTAQTMIIANQNFDGLYQDWGGFSVIPYLGAYSTVSLLNNGVDNLGGLGNLNNISNAVNVDWQNGLTALYSQERASYPANFILAGNSGWGGQQVLSSYTSALQGTQVEDFLNSVASSTGWQGAMYTYGTWAMNGQTPNFSLIQANITFGGASNDANHLLYDLMVSSGNNWLTSTQLQQLRFGLASALMFNGYFATSNTNASAGGYSAAFWLDEYAVNSSGTAVVPTDATAAAARAAKGWLGSPLAAAFNASNYPANVSQTLWSVLSTGVSNASNTNVWRRDYTNGIVLVNPTTSSQTVSLGGTFKKISGVVDPTFNNGATGITSVTLAPSSGIVLHR